MLELRFLGIAERTNTSQWLHPMALHNSEAIQGILGQGALTVQRAGVGQQVKPRKCRAGGGSVGGSGYSHKAASQTNLDEFPQHLAQPPNSPARFAADPKSPNWVFVELCRF